MTHCLVGRRCTGTTSMAREGVRFSDVLSTDGEFESVAINTHYLNNEIDPGDWVGIWSQLWVLPVQHVEVHCRSNNMMVRTGYFMNGRK